MIGRYADGLEVGTSIVVVRNGLLITTESGSKYILGMRRRTALANAKPTCGPVGAPKHPWQYCSVATAAACVSSQGASLVAIRTRRRGAGGRRQRSARE